MTEEVAADVALILLLLDNLKSLKTVYALRVWTIAPAARRLKVGTRTEADWAIRACRAKTAVVRMIRLVADDAKVRAAGHPPCKRLGLTH